jgi:hypothetical protein
LEEAESENDQETVALLKTVLISEPNDILEEHAACTFRVEE